MARKYPQKTFERIAKRHLNVPVLNSRGSDASDFHEVSVWGVEKALREAYEAGAKSCQAPKRKKGM